MTVTRTPQMNKTIGQLIADPKALFVVSHSGGKDSQAMYAYLRDKIPAERLVVIHADLGRVEWKGTFEHVQRYVTHELHKIKSPDLLELVEKRGKWPGGIARYCTSTLKTDPIHKLADQIRIQKGMTYIVNCIGIRGEESQKRDSKPAFEYNEDKSAFTKGRYVYNWLPIKEWTTRDVLKFIEINGEELHEAYKFGMTRLSCCFCYLASKSDLQISAKHNPELLETYAKLEEKIGHTMKMSGKNPIKLREWIGLSTTPAFTVNNSQLAFC